MITRTSLPSGASSLRARSADTLTDFETRHLRRYFKYRYSQRLVMPEAVRQFPTGFYPEDIKAPLPAFGFAGKCKQSGVLGVIGFQVPV
jgi:hypothetical protein